MVLLESGSLASQLPTGNASPNRTLKKLSAHAIHVTHTYLCDACGTRRRPHSMKTLDGLRAIPPGCDLLIFDDMRFDAHGLALTPEEAIAVLDVMVSTSIKCRHVDGVIPCLPRILITNLACKGQEYPFPSGQTTAQENAIRRRFVVHRYINEWMFKASRRSISDMQYVSATGQNIDSSRFYSQDLSP